jgi:hypothetical protein
MGTYRDANQPLTGFTVPSGYRNTAAERRRREQESLRSVIMNSLVIDLPSELDKPVFRFNDLNTRAQRRYVWLFHNSTRHMHIRKMPLPTLMNTLIDTNPEIWGSWGTQLSGSETPRWRVQRISQWLYYFLWHPEKIIHERWPDDTIDQVDRINTASWPISSHKHNRTSNACKQWVEEEISN